MIKVGWVFSISNFFITETSLANNWRRKKIPSCSNSALVGSWLCKRHKSWQARMWPWGQRNWFLLSYGSHRRTWKTRKFLENSFLRKKQNYWSSIFLSKLGCEQGCPPKEYFFPTFGTTCSRLQNKCRGTLINLKKKPLKKKKWVWWLDWCKHV